MPNKLDHKRFQDWYSQGFFDPVDHSSFASGSNRKTIAPAYTGNTPLDAAMCSQLFRALEFRGIAKAPNRCIDSHGVYHDRSNNDKAIEFTEINDFLAFVCETLGPMVESDLEKVYEEGFEEGYAECNSDHEE